MKTTSFIYSKWLLSLALLFWQGIALAQAPYVSWQKSFGGSDDEVAYSVEQTTDGGYIMAGWSKSNDGDVTGNHGIYDCWIVKLDSTGTLSWRKSLGGSYTDASYSVEQTIDGGYIVAGESNSDDGDITGNHGIYDYLVIKLSANGDISWQKSLGGSWDEDAYSIQQTTDGGYIVAGESNSNDGEVTGNHGDYDYWIVKLDVNGNISWQKSLGGSSSERAYSVEQTTDGGYIVAGWSISYNGDVTGNHGYKDCWVVKLDTNGNLSWQKSLGGSGNDYANFIQQTTDGGYIVAGYSSSHDGDVTGNHGGYDYWIVKLAANGNLSWQKCFGGSNWDEPLSVEQTTDGGYIVAGYTQSGDGNVTGYHDSTDFWIVKLTANGNLSWQKCLGGSDYDFAYSIQQTTDGGYIAVGGSNSKDGDVMGNNGKGDFWIVKLGGFGVGTEEGNMVGNLSVYPNPVVGNSMSLDYYLGVATEVEISMIDMIGNNIEYVERGREAEGEQSRAIEVGHLASGVYFLELRTKYGRETVRWVKE